MKSVGIITFHASHNYGSMLQAYALQHVLAELGVKSEIINFRTDRQKRYYQPPFLKGRPHGRLYRLLKYCRYDIPLLRKKLLFEKFLLEDLIITKNEYRSYDELADAGFNYDVYISGSDQIWNPKCFDFDWSYFLGFVKKGKKIAYAPSIGPDPTSTDRSYHDAMRILLRGYDAVCVREQATADFLQKITGNIIGMPVMPDPTLLATREFWSDVAGPEPLVKGKYIFLYAPRYVPEVWQKADELSKQLGMKVVVSMFFGKKDSDSWLKKPEFEPYLVAGPKEFLNLCRYAGYVIGDSFHLVVFSFIFHKRFFTKEPARDARVANIMRLLGIPVEGNNDDIFYALSEKHDFNVSDECLQLERKRGLSWLKQNVL